MSRKVGLRESQREEHSKKNRAKSALYNVANKKNSVATKQVRINSETTTAPNSGSAPATKSNK
jgi:hypothetical protein